jgi:HKD family nuclease
VKKYSIVFIIALAIFGISARAFCYQAQVTDISGTKYFPAVKEALSRAEKSIYVVMFTIESTLSKPDSKPNQLINELIAAKNRGIEVEVILDQNVDFVQRRHAGDWESQIKSTRAYKRLKDAGIKVNYDEPARYAHAKTVIIDKKIVILGSTNWTESAFDNSIETDVLVNSQELAGEILAYLKTIKIDTKIDEYLYSLGLTVPIRWEFMENPDLAAGMVKFQDERAFDIYLYLLWKYDGNPQAKLTLFYDDLAKYLGIYEGWTSENYRRQIIKIFRKLEEKYKLLKFEPRYAKEATITLLNYDEDKGIYTIPDEQAPGIIGEAGVPPSAGYFELPEDYFNFSWNRRLSLRAKFCYLINLANTDVSDIKPFWSKSVSTITKQFGDIGQDIINKGMGELRRKNLLEVKYDELSGKLYEQRRPKMYKILKLYDPKECLSRLKALEEKYGKAEYAKARKYAEIVFEENNPEVIEDIILKTKQYGEKEIKRVFDIVSQKNIDNPKRTYIYVTRIIGRAE